MINLIVAKASNDIIGKDNSLLWHLSEDLKYFKRITLGKTVLMGRKTWESLPFKPLKNRRNIVITSQKDYKAQGAEVFPDLEQALSALEEQEVFCIGGASPYAQLLPHCHSLYITQLFKPYQGDVSFPEIDSTTWHQTRLSPLLYDQKEAVSYRFEVWERRIK